MIGQGPTLGFESRADFLAWIREKEGPEAFEDRSPQDVCNWFICRFYGPENLSAAFRQSIRHMLAHGGHPARPPGALNPQKNRTIFALPPSRHWPIAMDGDLPDAVRHMPCLCVISAHEWHWRTTDYRRSITYLFYGDWRELRAAYRVARLILAHRDAAAAADAVHYIWAGPRHAEFLGIPVAEPAITFTR